LREFDRTAIIRAVSFFDFSFLFFFFFLIGREVEEIVIASEEILLIVIADIGSLLAQFPRLITHLGSPEETLSP